MNTKTFQHEFKDTGVIVTLRKVNPFMIQQARTELESQKPKPPTRTVDEPGPLFGTTEEMPHDPAYIDLLREWEKKVDESVMNMQIKRSIVKISDEAWAESVAELRAEWESLGIGGLPKDDLVCYISYIASGTPQDLQEFIQAIATRSQPTEEAIQAAKDSFPAPVQAPRRLGRQN